MTCFSFPDVYSHDTPYLAAVARMASESKELQSAVSFCKRVYVGLADKASVLYDVPIVRALRAGERGKYELFS